MAEKTLIEWADATWNPITGCSVVSAGCKNCYAMKEIRERKAAINRVLAPLLKREATIRARYEKRPPRAPAQPRLF